MPDGNLLELLRNNGYKLTPQRRRIIEALRKAGRRLTAKEIHSILRAKEPRLSLDTVYRNLRLLGEIGAVHHIPLNSGAVYETAADLNHHHHLVCIDCEKVVCISYCPDLQGCSEQAYLAGFDLLGHSFELYGRCADCRQKKQPGC